MWHKGFMILTGTLVLSGLLYIAEASGGLVHSSQALQSDVGLGSPEDRIVAAGRVAGPQAVTGLASSQDGSDQSNYDVLFYDIYLRIHDTSFINGEVTFTVRILENDTRALVVDLGDNMVVDFINSEEPILGFVHDNNHIRIELEDPYNSGDTVVFSVGYHGHGRPYGSWKAGLMFAQLGTATSISSFSAPGFARLWWPCKDRPDDKAIFRTVDIEVNPWAYAISNGVLDSVIADEAHQTLIYRYGHDHPMATYLFGVAAVSDALLNTRDTMWVTNDGIDSLPMTVYWLSQDTTDIYPEAMTTMSRAMGIFSDVFGPYPFLDEKFDLAVVYAGDGSNAEYRRNYDMEIQTVPFMQVKSGMAESKIVHELAHQWWGNSLTPASWEHVWLSEGWACYAEALYYERTKGFSEYLKYVNDKTYGFRYGLNPPGVMVQAGSVFVQDTADIDMIYHLYLTYRKAPYVLHMLRHQLGDTTFFQCIDAWYQYGLAHDSATTADFEEVFEQTSGESLDKFIDQWIYGEGYPTYKWSYLQFPIAPGSNDRQLFLVVDQDMSKQSQLFDMKLDFVAEFAGGGDTVLTFRVDSARSRLSAVVADECDTIRLDPLQWVLLEEEALDPLAVRIATPRDGLDTAFVGVDYADKIELLNHSNQFEFNQVGSDLPDGFELSKDGHISFSTGLNHPPDPPTQSIQNRFIAYTFSVRVDDLGNGSFDSASFDLVIDRSAVDVPFPSPLPDRFLLHQNHPNPFNNGTVIQFEIPTVNDVTMDVYNVLGQKVKTLINKQRYSAGVYSVPWFGDDDAGNLAATGIYFYRLEAGEFVESRKMLFIK